MPSAVSSAPEAFAGGSTDFSNQRAGGELIFEATDNILPKPKFDWVLPTVARFRERATAKKKCPSDHSSDEGCAELEPSTFVDLAGVPSRAAVLEGLPKIKYSSELAALDKLPAMMSGRAAAAGLGSAPEPRASSLPGLPVIDGKGPAASGTGSKVGAATPGIPAAPHGAGAASGEPASNRRGQRLESLPKSQARLDEARRAASQLWCPQLLERTPA